MHPDGPGALTAARSPVKVRPVGSDPAFIRPAHVRWLSVNPFSSENKACSALDPDKGTELELTVYTLTVHDGGVNQGLCAESKMYIDDLRVKCEVGRGEVHVHL